MSAKCGVYILKCRNGRYYVGSTNSLERRLEEHQNQRVKATKYLQPVKLVAFLPQPDLLTARQIEIKIKKQKSSYYIEKLIRATSSVG